ncbi:MAG: hypothetical protein E7658_07425 [Ruminococcaceae bacterium]|nr:hypothetical protein [Oscillospiraceae bacterium]
MKTIHVNNKGFLSFTDDEKTYIIPSPIGLLVAEDCAYAPLSAETDGENITVNYEKGTCRLTLQNCGGYYKITVKEVPAETDRFIFGPYETEAVTYGEILGAGWYEDGSVVCIQSLMPKVISGFGGKIAENKTGLDLGMAEDAASEYNGKVYLKLAAVDRTKYTTKDYLGMKNVIVEPAPMPDALIDDSSIALLAADSADTLLDTIGEMELAEGLPHPTHNGEFAKKCRRASAHYLIFGGSGLTNEERVALAGRSGVSCVYFAGVIEKWGHFTADKVNFPGGVSEVAYYSDKIKEYGVHLGAHSLSNFITTNDEYVTPVPHEKLLVMDKSKLTKDLKKGEAEVFVADVNNFQCRSALNVVRIGNELIQFGGFDADRLCLTGCTRGAFDTVESAHTAGDVVDRLWDHGYGTLFPNIELQSEMAEHLGNFLKDAKIHRFSFDGVEGCDYTGYLEYARAAFVKKTLETAGREVVCDGSCLSHYLWHAYAYANWGEPWYDSERRGGMYLYRVNHMPYFDRNLMPRMMGWYSIHGNDGHFEATPPENMEYMLSREVAYDAGAAIHVSEQVAKEHGLINKYMDMIKLWGDFREEADIPDDLREKMQEEQSDWHLEKTEDGWELSRMIIRTQDLAYGDRPIHAEAGVVDNKVTANADAAKVNHSAFFVAEPGYPGVKEPLHLRIRVGEPGHGYMENVQIVNMNWDVQAQDGDYLEYYGGDELYLYDKNFNLKKVVRGTGTPLPEAVTSMIWNMIRYTTDTDEHARYIMKDIRTVKTYHIKPKQK